MSLTDLASIGSFISGLAVAASLLYLALQTHQNSKHTRALIQQSRFERITNQQLMMADADLVAAWLAANGEEATSEAIKARQFRIQGFTYWVGWDDTVTQHHDGLISAEQFNRFKGQMVAFVKTSPGFRNFLTETLAEQPTGPSKLNAFVRELLSETAAPGTT
jgi:hypothetical protein